MRMRNDTRLGAFAGFHVHIHALSDRGVRAAINAFSEVKQEADGVVMNAGQRINIHDALAAYTINGARLMGHDNKLGSIEVGKTADLIVLNQNVVELAEQGQADRIGETQVDMIIFDGNIVFEREQAMTQ